MDEKAKIDDFIEVSKKFDYGKKMKETKFWINMMESQVEELKENKKSEHINDEFVDCILVSIKALMELDDDPNKTIKERLNNISERIDEIQESYKGNGFKGSGD